MPLTSIPTRGTPRGRTYAIRKIIQVIAIALILLAPIFSIPVNLGNAGVPLMGYNVNPWVVYFLFSTLGELLILKHSRTAFIQVYALPPNRLLHPLRYRVSIFLRELVFWSFTPLVGACALPVSVILMGAWSQIGLRVFVINV